MDKTKKCRGCNKELNLNKFSKDKRSKDLLKNKCKKCNKIYQIFYIYKITKEKLEELILKQENRCACCENELNEEFQIDHNHYTGKVRGLLCKHCNLAIGLLKEDKKILTRAIDYLKRSKISNHTDTQLVHQRNLEENRKII